MDGRARDLATPGGLIGVFSDWRQLPVTTDAVQCAGWVWRGIVPWDKTEASRPQRGRYRNQTGFVAWASNGPRPLQGQVTPGVLRMPVPPYEAPHRRQAGRTDAGAVGRDGGPVLDPFAGSATIGVACLERWLEYVGMEVDDAYFEIACRRLEEAFKSSRLAAT